LVRPGDAGELAQAMAALSVDRELADQLREKGFQRAALFSWQKTAAQTIAVYEEVAGA
jgi:alpha-1,3-rhamnosyl/mannosyltransferase